ncbi:MAG: hypothetical protein ISN29_05085 [Gammaproteobacteria bacterium AqS3]|nr:hypothetical protein [Gammaproteobacteria bacterium AqS3]
MKRFKVQSRHKHRWLPERHTHLDIAEAVRDAQALATQCGRDTRVIDLELVYEEQMPVVWDSPTETEK